MLYYYMNMGGRDEGMDGETEQITVLLLCVNEINLDANYIVLILICKNMTLLV